MQTTFKLFNNVRIVRGASRSTICDLQRQNYEFLPNDIADIFEGNVIQTSRLKTTLSEEDYSVLRDYIDHFIENDFGIEGAAALVNSFADETSGFEAVPNEITNGIIDCDRSSRHDYERYFAIYKVLGCRNLQLRFFDTTEAATLREILSQASAAELNSINLIVRHEPGQKEEFYIGLIERFPFIQRLTVHDYHADAVLREHYYGFGEVLAVKQVITGADHCGFIHHADFVVGLDTFNEALKYNSCLNRKLSVDADGLMCNCPSLNAKYGSFTLENALQVKDDMAFRSYWGIHKQQIDVCKECEFRFICTDCRAFLNGELYGKPARCTYDPATQVWGQHVKPIA